MFGWSLSLGRIAGTEVRIHLTFFLLVAWFAVSAGVREGGAAAVEAALFTLAVFGCVLLHEYGHVLTARRFGIGTHDITLLPIGGVASIERMPENPTQELLIAIAGPAVNVAIALVLIVLFGADLSARNLEAAAIEKRDVDFVTRLALVNVMLVVFNLIPAFPMDGGRILRAVLAYGLDRGTATRVAAGIGQTVAFGLGFLGLFGNPMLLLIAIFVFMAASQESYAVELGEATRGVAMQRATITSFASLETSATVADAVDLLLKTTQREFPVTDGAGQLRGVLTRDGMIRALSASGPATPVLDVMDRDIPTISHRAPLAEAAKLLQTSGKAILGVVDDGGRVTGLVSLENLAEYMMVNAAGRRWNAGDAVRRSS